MDTYIVEGKIVEEKIVEEVNPFPSAYEITNKKRHYKIDKIKKCISDFNDLKFIYGYDNYKIEKENCYIMNYLLIKKGYFVKYIGNVDSIIFVNTYVFIEKMPYMDYIHKYEKYKDESSFSLLLPSDIDDLLTLINDVSFCYENIRNYIKDELNEIKIGNKDELCVKIKCIPSIIQKELESVGYKIEKCGEIKKYRYLESPNRRPCLTDKLTIIYTEEGNIQTIEYIDKTFIKITPMQIPIAETVVIEKSSEEIEKSFEETPVFKSRFGCPVQ